MAIHKATLAKEIDSTMEYIYPKTTSDIVEYVSGVSVYDKLSEVSEVIDTLDTNLDTINESISTLTTNVSTNASNIEGLNTTVDGHTSSISTLEDENAEVHYYFNAQNSNRINSGATNTIHGECNIIKAYGKIIMIDTGGYNRSDDIEAYLSEIGVTKVDYLIISHWHMDHCSNFSNGLMDYLDWSDCVCYFPVNVPSWMLDYSSATTYKANAVAYAEANCAQIIYPEEYDELELNDYFKITFFNCGSTYLEEIKSLQDDIEEFAGHYTASYTSQYYMNDSSMVCLVNHMGSKVFYSGDVMKAAQQRIYKAGFANDVDVYKMHHHGVNLASNNQQTSNYLYCRAVNPSETIVQNQTGSSKFITSATSDLYYFNKSNVYIAYDSYIEYSSSSGFIHHITSDEKIVVAEPKEYDYNVFVDWTQPSSVDSTADGSYWNPFRSQVYAARWFDNNNDNGSLACVQPCFIIMEGDSAESATSTGIESLKSFGIAYIYSYDYYKGNIGYSADSNGHMSDEALESIRKYVLRGYVLVQKHASLMIRGIRIAPNDTSFKITNISSYWMQSEHGQGISTLCYIRNGGQLDIAYCIFDYDDVSTDVVNEYCVNTDFTCAIIPAHDSSVNLRESYISNMMNAVYSNSKPYIKIYNLEIHNVIKVIQSNPWAGTEVTMVLGTWLLGLDLGYPSYVSSNSGSYLTLTMGCNVSINQDLNTTNKAFTYNGETLNCYELVKKIAYPINYRSSNPITRIGYIANKETTYFEFQSAITSEPRWHDIYGGRSDLAQCGAYNINGGISIDRLVEVSEDYYDWDNILFPGCWPVIGTNRLSDFTNTPSGTGVNGKLICEWLGGSTTTNASYYRQTYIDRVGRKFERVYSNTWTPWITITGDLFNSYTDNGGYLLAITTQPESISVDQGGDGTFSVEAVASSSLKYDWFYRDKGTTSFTQADTYESTISITMDSTTTKEICCVVSDSSGHSITSDIVTMAVPTT